jgi:predicted GIY-YIG superfamily endonuclease
MHCVYLLRSESHPAQTYIGSTADLRQRLTTHHAGGSLHTAKFRPWCLETYLAFLEKSKATAFEKYLKSHSGKAFAPKRLWPAPA